MKKIIYILPGAFLLRFKKNESLLKFPSIISMLNINLLFNPLIFREWEVVCLKIL